MDMKAPTPAPASTAAPMGGGGGMGGGGMGGGSGCKISMLWNWYTIDSCFIAKSWHVRSALAFAVSCLGVVVLVLLLEGLRRAGKEYDRRLIRQHMAAHKGNPAGSPIAAFRPSLVQQAIRAMLHTAVFTVSYFVMLLAMYYNGYILICIFIGAYLGSFIFQWESIPMSSPQTSATGEPTVCCG